MPKKTPMSTTENLFFIFVRKNRSFHRHFSSRLSVILVQIVANETETDGIDTQERVVLFTLLAAMNTTLVLYVVYDHMLSTCTATKLTKVCGIHNTDF